MVCSVGCNRLLAWVSWTPIEQVPHCKSGLLDGLLVGFASSSQCCMEHPIASRPVQVTQLPPHLPTPHPWLTSLPAWQWGRPAFPLFLLRSAPYLFIFLNFFSSKNPSVFGFDGKGGKSLTRCSWSAWWETPLVLPLKSNFSWR